MSATAPEASGDATLLENAWRDSQSASIAAVKVDREAQSRASSTRATLEARAAAVAKLSAPQRGIDDIDTEHQVIFGAIEELGKIADVALLAQEVEELRQGKQSVATKLQQADSTLSKATTAEAVSHQAYADRIASVPEALRDPVDLQTAINDVTNDINRRRKAIAVSLLRRCDGFADWSNSLRRLWRMKTDARHCSGLTSWTTKRPSRYSSNCFTVPIQRSVRWPQHS